MSRGLSVLLLGMALTSSMVCFAQVKSPPISQPVSTRQKKRDEAIIILNRDAGYWGIAPVYKIIIYPDGSVAFIGTKNTKIKGLAESRISREALHRIVSEFERINYFSLRDKYDAGEGCPFSMSDDNYAYTWFRLGERRKSVLHYQGCHEDHSKTSIVFPQDLYNLENLIDVMVNSKQWVK